MNVALRSVVGAAGLWLVALMTDSTLMTSRAASSPAVTAKAQRTTVTTGRKVEWSYQLALPKGYAPRSGKRWPMVIFLHGAGERGTNLNLVAVHGPPKLIQQRRELPCIVVSPQCPADRTWDVEALEALLAKLLRAHAVDPRRVYLTGLSMGGYGTWAWAGAYPERFAAIAPICGGGDWVSVWLSGGARREALKRLPIWAFHGAKDNVVPLAESERMVDGYRRLGNEPRLTTYPDAGHDSWTATYEDPAFWEWLFRQQLPAARASARGSRK